MVWWTMAFPGDWLEGVGLYAPRDLVGLGWMLKRTEGIVNLSSRKHTREKEKSACVGEKLGFILRDGFV
jgi:hypothetical protein